MSRRLRKGRMSRRLRKYRGGSETPKAKGTAYAKKMIYGDLISKLGPKAAKEAAVGRWGAEAFRGAEAAQARPPPAGSGDSGFGSGASSRTGSDDSGGSGGSGGSHINPMYDAGQYTLPSPTTTDAQGYEMFEKGGAPLKKGRAKGKGNRMMKMMPLGYGTKEQRAAAIREQERAELESSNRTNRTIIELGNMPYEKP